MIKHIVLFKLKESEQKEAQMHEIKNQLEQLIHMIPELKEIHVGVNINSDEKWDLSLEVIVENLHDLNVYAQHPAHQHILKTQIAPVKAERACVDFRME